MSAEANAEAVFERLKPSLDSLAQRVAGVAAARDQRWRKYFKLVEIADETMKLVDPSTPCKRGCAHCCHMAVAVSDHEASLIEKFIDRPRAVMPKGRTARRPADAVTIGKALEANIKRYSGVRCTFLGSENECTIHPVRPMACRLHHSLHDSPEPCDIVNSDGALVPTVNIHALQGGSVMVTMPGPYGDIREFFPA